MTDRSDGTLTALLRIADPNATAIMSIDGAAVTYRQVVDVVDRLTGQLRDLGVRRNDRVAIVLPNGPETALMTLGSTACATAAPLNPGYRLHELSLYLQDLQPSLIVCRSDIELGVDSDTPVATVHGDLADLHIRHNGSSVEAINATMSAAADVALILHTSGTTSRPKQVPLTHRNLVTSAFNVAETLQLTPRDRCLNVMPLFHIHGLVGALFATIAAGASIACSPGFNAFQVRRWLATTESTWMTAVPTMYQLILARIGRHSEEPIPQLRFLRSSSASMQPSVMSELEDMFGAPLIEAYGMTEAAHQISSNPLPPAERKPGSVGRFGATKVRVETEDGTDAAPGEEGEVLIQGASLVNAYRVNPEADDTSFVDGWFRTGDSGRFDQDGYLYLTGRIKEIINRGGTKISPRQIDEVLLEHPGVAEAASFAVSHRWLGEEVAAAVVPETRFGVTEDELRAHVAGFLSHERVPKTIVFVDEIPRGSTGKLQRQRLATELGLE